VLPPLATLRNLSSATDDVFSVCCEQQTQQILLSTRLKYIITHKSCAHSEVGNSFFMLFKENLVLKALKIRLASFIVYANSLGS
jgi:hypothetical protein